MNHTKISPDKYVVYLVIAEVIAFYFIAIVMLLSLRNIEVYDFNVYVNLLWNFVPAASYRGPGEDEEPDHYAERIAFTGNSRILGPGCIVVGFFMLVAGCVLCVLTRRARRREQTIGFHCPLHGDFYPLSPVTSSRTIGKLLFFLKR